MQLTGHAGFVGCHATMVRAGVGSATEHWFLLDLCPNGSLVDLLYTKSKSTGEYERKPALSQSHVLEVFEQIVAAVAHMHALSPPVAHRDLKLENVLCTEDGRSYVLCDFGSATTDTLPAEWVARLPARRQPAR